jgi:hypothetical protein
LDKTIKTIIGFPRELNTTMFYSGRSQSSKGDVTALGDLSSSQQNNASDGDDNTDTAEGNRKIKGPSGLANSLLQYGVKVASLLWGAGL